MLVRQACLSPSKKGNILGTVGRILVRCTHQKAVAATM